MIVQKISLIGYMGSGKTTLGKLLAKELALPFYDLDDEIEKKENLSIPEIFFQKGELYFRKIEKKVLENLLELPENFVISTGGGTPAYYDNMQLLNTFTKSFYLMCNTSTLAQRLEKEKENRPLLQKFSENSLAEYIGNHLLERNPYYLQAQYRIKTDCLTPNEIVEEMTKMIG